VVYWLNVAMFYHLSVLPIISVDLDQAHSSIQSNVDLVAADWLHPGWIAKVELTTICCQPPYEVLWERKRYWHLAASAGGAIGTRYAFT
jgi:hypothetical protein